jgi:hypothetical protein
VKRWRRTTHSLVEGAQVPVVSLLMLAILWFLGFALMADRVLGFPE